MALKNPATGYGVEVSYPDFATVAFWTAAATKAPFLCVEPWNGSAIRSDEDDNFLNRHFLQKLEGGESKEYRIWIKINTTTTTKKKLRLIRSEKNLVSQTRIS